MPILTGPGLSRQHSLMNSEKESFSKEMENLKNMNKIQIEEIFDNNPEALTSILNLLNYMNISYANYYNIIDKINSFNLEAYIELLSSFFLYINITSNKYHKEMQISNIITIKIKDLTLINLQLTDYQLDDFLNGTNKIFITNDISFIFLEYNNITKIPYILTNRLVYPKLKVLNLNGNPITFAKTHSQNYISENNIEEIKNIADGISNDPYSNIEICKYIVELYKNYKQKIKPKTSRFETKEQSRKSHIQKMQSNRRRSITRHTSRKTNRKTNINTSRHTSRQPTII
jgi:hypothetical protein